MKLKSKVSLGICGGMTKTVKPDTNDKNTNFFFNFVIRHGNSPIVESRLLFHVVMLFLLILFWYFTNPF